jgi:hypothetical protein
MRIRNLVAHVFKSSTGRVLLNGKPEAPALLHLFGKLTHRFPRDDTPFPTGKRGFRLIHRGQDFRAQALAFIRK